MARAWLLILLILCAPAMADARRAKAPSGTLTLDMDAPFVTAEIGGQTLRLRVAPEQKRLVELNRAAADRLDLPFEKGAEAEVGRVTVPAITAGAKLRIDGREIMAQIVSHDRDCCADADGEIAMSLLPYATILMIRTGAPAGLPERHFLIEDSLERGPETRLTIGGKELFAAFSLTRSPSVATWSAAVILAGAYGGKLQAGPTAMLASAFGVERPVRTLRFDRIANVAGFGFDSLPVRIADFGGHYDFAPDADAMPTDIVVKGRSSPQEAWPLVLIGRDRLDRCSELRFDNLAKTLTLACAP